MGNENWKILLILGIDPGTATTGFGFVQKKGDAFKVLRFGTVTTSPKNTSAQRLDNLYRQMNLLLKKTKPDLVAIECLYFFKNLKTAIPVAQAAGVIMLAVQRNRVKIIELTPLETKMGICGYGRADKNQMQKMVKNILHMQEIPKPDDAADALAIAICAGLKYTTKR